LPDILLERSSMRLPFVALLTSAILSLTAPALAASPSTDCQPTQPCAKPLPVKVVIVSLFEIGADEGDAAGEFQLWKTRRGLTTRIAFPQGYHDLYYNPRTQVLGMVTGVGTARSTAATMALGLDPRFDLAQAYWLVAGIAGIDPEDASIGSVAWARYVVDGDLAHEIDAREIPKDWPTGYFPRNTQGPNDTASPLDAEGGEVFALNPALVSWAYRLTRDMALPDSPALSTERARFTGYPKARKPPFVLQGEQLSAMTDWANAWTRRWTDGKGEFVTSAMEDTGVLQAMTYLDRAGRADKDRVLVLRAGSNYTMPPPGVDAASYLLRENEGYAGLATAVENLYRVGGKVVDALLSDWDRYGAEPPR
jgi:purine nucleoside permease